MVKNKILCGSATDILPTLPAESVNCVVTSPPYWAKRRYRGQSLVWADGWTGELGLEPEPNMYIDHLCAIFDQIKRVLRKDGVLWVVIGDTMSGSGGDHKPHHGGKDEYKMSHDYSKKVGQPKNKSDFPKKCQCCVPERFSIEMINRGWIRRSTCLWHKPNPKPESVKDRFTNDFEYVYMFVKNKKYYFDQQYEPTVTAAHKPGWATDCLDNNDRRADKTDQKVWGANGLRQLRTTFNVVLQPYKGAHFAVFPEKLIEPLIKATCPKWVCDSCGKIAAPVYGSQTVKRRRPQDRTDRQAGDGGSNNTHAGVNRQLKGYKVCDCAADFNPGVVLDPFVGAGTTAMVANRLERNWIGIELNKSFVRMAYKRLKKQKRLVGNATFHEKRTQRHEKLLQASEQLQAENEKLRFAIQQAIDWRLACNPEKLEELEKEFGHSYPIEELEQALGKEK